ncbi:MAG: hypothetical protein ACRC20_02635 [Segniliparus sp.]|uniref:hypothetical protein n=1 Tax=Segniliparus sp. TaxID=2804064 RepID=UPI003F414457
MGGEPEQLLALDAEGNAISVARWEELSDRTGEYFKRYSVSEKIGQHTVWTRWEGYVYVGIQQTRDRLFPTSRISEADPHRGEDWYATNWEDALLNHRRIVEGTREREAANGGGSRR